MTTRRTIRLSELGDADSSRGRFWFAGLNACDNSMRSPNGNGLIGGLQRLVMRARICAVFSIPLSASLQFAARFVAINPMADIDRGGRTFNSLAVDQLHFMTS